MVTEPVNEPVKAPPLTVHAGFSLTPSSSYASLVPSPTAPRHSASSPRLSSSDSSPAFRDRGAPCSPTRHPRSRRELARSRRSARETVRILVKNTQIAESSQKQAVLTANSSV